MDTFLKATGGILVALVFYLILAKQGKDISLLLTVVVCIMVVGVAVEYLTPVISVVEQLRSVGNLDSQMLNILLKTVAIALLAEIVENICSDSGNGAMGRSVQFLASGVILWMSVPLFNGLMDVLEEILVAI